MSFKTSLPRSNISISFEHNCGLLYTYLTVPLWKRSLPMKLHFGMFLFLGTPSSFYILCYSLCADSKNDLGVYNLQ